MPGFFSGKQWQLTCVQHTRRLIRMQHTRRLTRVQHTKYFSRASYNHAAHEDGSHAAHEIARVLYTKVNSRVTCEFGLSHLTKIEEHTYVAAHACQLRCELYRSILDHINFGIIFHILHTYTVS